MLILQYIQNRNRYLALPAADQNPVLAKAYKRWENLLNFLPHNYFYGQRPVYWWSHRHDIELLYLTFKHGYTNYQVMKTDPDNTYDKEANHVDTFTDVPNSDMITRRLKKLYIMISKYAESQDGFTFENTNMKEPSNLSLEEKNKVVSFLTNFGILYSADGKAEYQLIQEKLHEQSGKKLFDSKNSQSVEKFIQRLMIHCHEITVNQGHLEPMKFED